MTRPLTLHASALSDAEYTLFTADFRDLLDDSDTTARPDAYYEDATLGVREVRAWLRGRHPDLALGDLDTILKLFCPTLDRTDQLDGGQFFAAQRLLNHVLGGASVDRNLVFVQSSPSPVSRPTSPSKVLRKPIRAPPPPRHPPTRRQTYIHTPEPPSPDAGTSDGPTPDVEPPSQAHKRSASMTYPSAPGSNNPFTQAGRSRTETPLSVKTIADKSGLSSTSLSTSTPGKQPPLPPRKPSGLMPPPRPQTVSSSSAPEPPPRRPPPPPVPSTSSTSVRSSVSPLIQASLHASKVAQVSREAEERLSQARVLHVVKSSSPGPIVDTPFVGRSLSPSKSTPIFPRTSPSRPALPSRKRSSPIPYASSTISSDSERRRNTTFPAPEPPSIASNNPFRQRMTRAAISVSPTRSRDPPPPTHPDRKPQPSPTTTTGEYPDSLGSRLGRSRSLRQPSPSTPPAPPPRRRRPESVQITPTSSIDGSPFVTPPHSALPGVGSGSFRSPSTSSHVKSLSRHLSLSAKRPDVSPTRGASTSDDYASPFTNLQRHFQSLGVKAEAAMYKAEAGLNPRRGYLHQPGQRGRVRGDEGGLMRQVSASSVGVDRDDADSWSDRESSHMRPLSPRDGTVWSPSR